MNRANPQETDLHQRLIQREETASSELFSLYYDDFFKYFWKGYQNRLNEDDLKDIIADSFLKFIDHPNKFDPARSSLKKYLQADVRGDIINRVEKKTIKLVELDDRFRNSLVREDSPEVFFMKKELIEKARGKLQDWFEDGKDLEIAWNIVSNVRETEYYAAILEIQHQKIEQQKKEVKRHKDRIKKQLERRGWSDFLKHLRNG
jgi:DNA-directed RNA polymerase specialized sigma24 family protein